MATAVLKTTRRKREPRLTPNQVRAARKRIGYSQRELAEFLGVTVRAVQNWETEMHKGNYREIGEEYAVKLIVKRDEVVYQRREANRGW